MGEWGIAPPILNLSKHVGGSGQFHDLAALPLRKQPLIPMEWEAGWNLELVWILWCKKNVWTMQGLKSLFLS